MFFGFLSGLVAQDYDLEIIYIDGFLKIVQYDLDKLEEFFYPCGRIVEQI